MKERTPNNLFYKANITLTLKTGKDITRKANRSKSFIEAKIINKLLAQ